LSKQEKKMLQAKVNTIKQSENENGNLAPPPRNVESATKVDHWAYQSPTCY